MTGHKKAVPALRGLRHLALQVADMTRARDFYENLMGMTVVWEPDPENIYLTSGCDNLALHVMPEKDRPSFDAGKVQAMDHFGFIVESPEAVQAYEERMGQACVRIVKPFKRHRDGSSSFYMADPDGNVIQILYEPHISPMRLMEMGEGG